MNKKEIESLQNKKRIHELRIQAIKRRNELKISAMNKKGIVSKKVLVDVKKKVVERVKPNIEKVVSPKIKNPKRDLNKCYYKSCIFSLKNKKITKLDLPRGCFNGGLAKNPFGGYIMVYRPDEHSFKACCLDENYKIIDKPHHQFLFNNCADPRLIWVKNKLLLVYSSTSGTSIKKECIRASIIMDLDISNDFLNNEQFKISPESEERHKNWMPFVYEDDVHLISNVLPHKIYKLNLESKSCELKYENNWFSPWPIKQSLRGNTNAARLDNGNYLSVFHTSSWENKRCHYDNGVYIFEGKPPFKVLKCSNKTFLPAEDAIEPHFRKADSILCPFPVGLLVEKDKIIISYGDNDSCVKILETTLQELESLMLEVY